MTWQKEVTEHHHRCCKASWTRDPYGNSADDVACASGVRVGEDDD